MPLLRGEKQIITLSALLEQLASARRIVEDGHEVVPAWLITTPEGPFLVLTRVDPDKEGQRERALHPFSSCRRASPSGAHAGTASPSRVTRDPSIIEFSAIRLPSCWRWSPRR